MSLTLPKKNSKKFSHILNFLYLLKFFLFKIYVITKFFTSIVQHNHTAQISHFIIFLLSYYFLYYALSIIVIRNIVFVALGYYYYYYFSVVFTKHFFFYSMHLLLVKHWWFCFSIPFHIIVYVFSFALAMLFYE